MDDEEPKERINTKPELIDDVFCDSRVKIEMILVLLSEKLQKLAEQLMESDAGIEKLGAVLDHLERLIFLGQMNRVKAKDLQHYAPKKYRRVLSDAELTKELRPVRDETNFPKRGPRGPREDAAGDVKAE